MSSLIRLRRMRSAVLLGWQTTPALAGVVISVSASVARLAQLDFLGLITCRYVQIPNSPRADLDIA